MDDEPASIGIARALVKATFAEEQVPITGVFGDVPAGEHTVSVWARANNGSATGARWDPGCWSSNNGVVVTEFH